MRGFFCYCFSNLAFSVLFFFVSWNNSTLAVFYHVTTLTLFISIVVVIFLVVVGIRATQRADSPQVSGMILSAFSSFCYFLPSFSLVQLLLLLSFKQDKVRLAIWTRATHNGKTSALFNGLYLVKLELALTVSSTDILNIV